jgi:RNA polymerase sigma-70 factor, ECF subfamily
MANPDGPIDHEAHEKEFVGLLTRHQSDIYLYLRSLVLNPDEASDILQDTNLVLWEKRRQFQTGTNFRAWAFQIARYKLLQSQAHRKREGVCFSDALLEELVLQVSRGNDTFDELIDDLRDCIARLSPEDQDLIGKRYGPHATCGSVADSIGRPVRWVYKAVNKIRKTLLECILQKTEGRKDQ